MVARDGGTRTGCSLIRGGIPPPSPRNTSGSPAPLLSVESDYSSAGCAVPRPGRPRHQSLVRQHKSGGRGRGIGLSSGHERHPGTWRHDFRGFGWRRAEGYLRRVSDQIWKNRNFRKLKIFFPRGNRQQKKRAPGCMRAYTVALPLSCCHALRGHHPQGLRLVTGGNRKVL